MRYLPSIAGALLGLLFIMAATVYFFKLVAMPPPPAGSLMALFMGAFASGYLDFVKVLELVGGVLVAIPLTRRLGLLVLGPIIVNILAYHVFVAKCAYIMDPMLILIVVLALYLLWTERRAFAAYLRGA